MLHRPYYIYTGECNGPRFQVKSPRRRNMIKHMNEIQTQMQEQLKNDPTSRR